MNKQSKFKNLINELGIDETLTKPPIKEKQFTTFKIIAPPIKGYNYEADLLYLPTTSKGFKYALTMVDLGNNKFDLEPLKKKDSESVLKGMKEIFKRKILSEPKASLQTDEGTEFKQKFHQWLYDNDIYHKFAGVARHSQMAPVESLNKQLGRLFNGYMNKIEKKTGKGYNDWTDIIQTVRTDLNKIRERKEQNPFTYIPPLPNFLAEPKYKVGDLVHYKLDYPLNALNEKQSNNFRIGDYRYSLEPRKITKVLNYPNPIPFRYMLNGINNMSFTEKQLILSKHTDEKYYVKKIIDKKTVNKKIYYLVWWKNYKKDQSTWEPKDQLISDGLDEYIKEFEKQNMIKKK
jgi:hypothetical protein